MSLQACGTLENKMSGDTTLREHALSIASAGGKARAAQMTAKERQAFGEAGGAARAESLTAKQRSDIARKAALARWDPKKKTAETSPKRKARK